MPCNIISVGNISLGGSGKTPTAIYIGRFLMDNSNKKVAVVGHGYKGMYKGDLYIVSDGEEIFMNYRECGEEAIMTAFQLKGVPVIIGKDRYKCIDYALKRFDIDTVILDDAFQYLKVIKDIDILLMDSSVPFSNNYLIPRGMLRESIDSITRSDIIILTRVKEMRGYEDILKIIRSKNVDSPIYYSYYEPISLIDLNSNMDIGVDYIKNRKISAMAGIGNPSSFFTMLDELGAILKEKILFPDHYLYSVKDIKKLNSNVPIITTEKDSIKLKGLPIDHLKIMSLNVRLRFHEEEKFKNNVLEMLNG